MHKIDGVFIDTATPGDIIQDNIAAAKTRHIEPIYNLPEWREGTPVAIVGGGPSLSTQLDKLRQYPYIIACGSVHDYLLENKITPNWCVIVDPDPVVNRYLTKRNNWTKYLVASQCSPATFDYLKDSNVYMWHAGGHSRNFVEGDIVLGGGCTVGTRAMIIAMCFGFKQLHLFGMDTCVIDEDNHHAYKFATEQESIGKIHEIALGGPDGQKFKIADYMLGQIFDFKNILHTCANKLDITVHGGGTLAYIMEYGKKLALEKENGNGS